MIAFYHVSGGNNPAGILSKHYRYIKILDILQPLIFCVGDTINFQYLDLS